MSTTEFIIGAWIKLYKEGDGDFILSSGDNNYNGVRLIIKKHDIRYIKKLKKDLEKAEL